MRFYDVTRGSILIDGIDLREHDLNQLASLRRRPARSIPLHRTIGENIRLGNTDITDEHLRIAAENVNVMNSSTSPAAL